MWLSWHMFQAKPSRFKSEFILPNEILIAHREISESHFPISIDAHLVVASTKLGCEFYLVLKEERLDEP